MNPEMLRKENSVDSIFDDNLSVQSHSSFSSFVSLQSSISTSSFPETSTVSSVSSYSSTNSLETNEDELLGTFLVQNGIQCYVKVDGNYKPSIDQLKLLADRLGVKGNKAKKSRKELINTLLPLVRNQINNRNQMENMNEQQQNSIPFLSHQNATFFRNSPNPQNQPQRQFPVVQQSNSQQQIQQTQQQQTQQQNPSSPTFSFNDSTSPDSMLFGQNQLLLSTNTYDMDLDTV